MLLPSLFISIFALIPFFWLMIPDSPQLIGKAVHRVETKKKVVALTFDDGPDQRYTGKILDILKKYNVKAVFFCIGKKIVNNEQLIKRIIVFPTSMFYPSVVSEYVAVTTGKGIIEGHWLFLRMASPARHF